MPPKWGVISGINEAYAILSMVPPPLPLALPAVGTRPVAYLRHMPLLAKLAHGEVAYLGHMPVTLGTPPTPPLEVRGVGYG